MAKSKCKSITRSTEHTLLSMNSGKEVLLREYMRALRSQIALDLDYMLSGKLPIRKRLKKEDCSYPQEHVNYARQAQMCWAVAYGIYTGQKTSWVKQKYAKFGKVIRVLKQLTERPDFEPKSKVKRKRYTHYRTILRRFPKLCAVLLSYDGKVEHLCDWDKRYRIWLSHHKEKVAAKATLPINANLVSFQVTSGYYNTFAKFKLHTGKARKRDFINIGIRYHKRYRKFIEEGWKRKATLMLFEKNGKLMVNFIWEIPVPKLVSEIKILGIDMGVNKLMALSNGICLGKLKPLYHKIANCLRGSKRYKGLVKHKNNLVNQLAKRVISLMKAQGYTALQLEQLTLRASRIRGMNKLQYWVHKALVNKLQELLQMEGFHMFRVNPQYTSQTCSRCGDTNKDSRNGESFKCVRCGYECDADINAARNIQELQVDEAKSPLPGNQKADLP